MSSQARVLIVDSSAESRDILRILLQRQGAETLEATEAVSGKRLLQQQQPDLVLFDADCDSSPSRQETHELGLTATRSATPIVVLGTAPRERSGLSTGQFISKPYHYAGLVRKIETMLESRL